MQAPGGSKGLVLCYHAVSPLWPAPLSVTPEQFQMQIRRLLARGYRPVTFGDAVAGAHQERTVAITFDDAYRSVIERAAPILADLGAPATVFAPSGYIGSERPMSWPGIEHWLGTEHEPELVPLNWRQLNELADAGWEVGSHTETHPYLTRLTSPALRHELAASRATIEDRLGRPCHSIAYPYGDTNRHVAAAAQDAGYRFGAALPGPPRGCDPLEWRRIGLYHRDARWRFELKVAASTRRLRASPWLGPLIAFGLARRGRKASRRRSTNAS